MSTNRKGNKKENQKKDIYAYLEYAVDFCKKNIRYVSAGVVFVILLVVLAVYTIGNREDNQLTAEAVTETEMSTEYVVDAYPAINELISNYYNAYASLDTNTLSTLASPMSDAEKTYVTAFGQHVEQFQNISCYTKKGLDDSSYIVSVYLEIKFKDVETAAPGLDFFYVRTNQDGSLYIDNVYSQFNISNNEVAQDATVAALIDSFEQQPDVIALQSDVQTKYEAAVASDENLKNMIETTIPGAIQQWATDTATAKAAAEAEAAAAEAAAAEAAAAEAAAAEAAAAEAAAAEAAAAEAAAAKTVYATDSVNVRSDANEQAEVIGKLAKGAQTTQLEAREDGWSRINYADGVQGYVKSEYLTEDAAAATATTTTTDTAVTNGSVSEGSTVRLEESVNIRESMDENAKKVATAYPGENLTVIMSYAEGWTKVTYGDKTGYVKTELIQ